MPKSRFARTYIDESNELSSCDFAIRDIDAGSIAAVLTEVAALGTALDNLSAGTLRKSILMQDSSAFGGAPPSDPNAQRERKWRVEFQDTVTGRLGKLEIPVAKVNATLKVAGSDLANLSDSVWVAFVNAFETTARSVEGNTVNVVRAVLVGRDL